MLIGLHTDDDITTKTDVANKLAEIAGGTTRIYNPRTIEDLQDAIKGYKPTAGNLILLSTHYDFEDQVPVSTWRVTDLLFDQRSGTVYGDNSRQPNNTYVGELSPDTYELLVTTGRYHEGRAKLIKKLTAKYYGRVSTDPHTLIVGFMPSVPKTSNHCHYLLRALPEEWWPGVAFTGNGDQVAKLVDWFYAADGGSTNIITMGDVAHDTLVELETPHLAVSGMSDLYRKTMDVDRNLGTFLREESRLVSVSGETRDQRSWRN